LACNFPCREDARRAWPGSPAGISLPQHRSPHPEPYSEGAEKKSMN
jgi:hypothetical protein